MSDDWQVVEKALTWHDAGLAALARLREREAAAVEVDKQMRRNHTRALKAEARVARLEEALREAETLYGFSHRDRS